MKHSEGKKPVLTASGLSGKTVTGVFVSGAGSLVVVEIAYSGGSQFIKSSQGQVEVGGTADFGSGTLIDLPVGQ
jgi:hypothetical protein